MNALRCRWKPRVFRRWRQQRLPSSPPAWACVSPLPSLDGLTSSAITFRRSRSLVFMVSWITDSSPQNGDDTATGHFYSAPIGHYHVAATGDSTALDTNPGALYNNRPLPGGVMVTRLTLDQLFKVRALARQPIAIIQRAAQTGGPFSCLESGEPGLRGGARATGHECCRKPAAPGNTNQGGKSHAARRPADSSGSDHHRRAWTSRS